MKHQLFADRRKRLRGWCTLALVTSAGLNVGSGCAKLRPWDLLGRLVADPGGHHAPARPISPRGHH